MFGCTSVHDRQLKFTWFEVFFEIQIGHNDLFQVETQLLSKQNITIPCINDLYLFYAIYTLLKYQMCIRITKIIPKNDLYSNNNMNACKEYKINENWTCHHMIIYVLNIFLLKIYLPDLLLSVCCMYWIFTDWIFVMLLPVLVWIDWIW